MRHLRAALNPLSASNVQFQAKNWPCKSLGAGWPSSSFGASALFAIRGWLWIGCAVLEVLGPGGSGTLDVRRATPHDETI